MMIVNWHFLKRVHENIQYLDEFGVYGTAAEFGQSKIPLNDKESAVVQYFHLYLALVESVSELRATFIELEKMNSEGIFVNGIDLSKIGLMRRCFSAITTLEGLMLEDKFTVGFANVPPSVPSIRAKVPALVLAAGDEELVVWSAQESKSNGRLPKSTFLFLGEEDRLILSIYNSYARDYGMTLSFLLNRYPLMKNAFDIAAVPAIYSVFGNINHGSFGVSGLYWWPNLKPNTYERYFDKDSVYTLLAAGGAHRLQSEMALAFFNLTIGGTKVNWLL